MPDWLEAIRGAWRLEGWDTFAGHSYAIPGRFWTRKQAVRAAKRYLAKLEKMQPREISGGQEGIQDQVFIVSPEGERTRVMAEHEG